MSNFTPKLTPEQIEEMQQLRDQGMILKDIAATCGVAYSTVSEKTKPRFREDPNWENKRNWPEWELWRNLHRRYGKRAAGGNK